ncbi:4'-phosphopantetheinyl transferase family protein [Paeniglutamicibacter sp. ORCA_105]|uniref:4'-phosphopantetheinyl transferase family protein n=1 Tax=Paeniglutamicibacter sp. ORCA_105 TaxID=3377336 RepID=UPI003894BB2B
MHDVPAKGLEAGLSAPLWATAPLAEAATHPEVRLLPDELARAGGYVPGRPREDFVAGRIMARVLGAGLLNHAVPPGRGILPGDLELTQYCPQCASEAHGTPKLRIPGTGEVFSLSYARTAGWLLLGLAPGNGRLGVDLADLEDQAFSLGEGGMLEEYAYAPEERERLELLPEAERQRLRARWWALKEAVAKASGEGLAGEAGIPVVAGKNLHPLLHSPGLRVLDLDPESLDSLGAMLPPHLVGSLVWAPGPEA